VALVAGSLSSLASWSARDRGQQDVASALLPHHFAPWTTRRLWHHRGLWRARAWVCHRASWLCRGLPCPSGKSPRHHNVVGLLARLHQQQTQLIIANVLAVVAHALVVVGDNRLIVAIGFIGFAVVVRDLLAVAAVMKEQDIAAPSLRLADQMVAKRLENSGLGRLIVGQDQDLKAAFFQLSAQTTSRH
jgi:hypothetical protein